MRRGVRRLRGRPEQHRPRHAYRSRAPASACMLHTLHRCAHRKPRAGASDSAGGGWTGRTNTMSVSIRSSQGACSEGGGDVPEERGAGEHR